MTPDVVTRILAYAGKIRAQVRNPNLTARETIVLANWIKAHIVDAPYLLKKALRELFYRADGWVPFDHAPWYHQQRDAIMRSLNAPAADRAVGELAGDFVEHSHPQFGAGYFCTPDVFARIEAAAPPADRAELARPKVVKRIMTYAGKRRSQVSNPCMTADEAIKLANWIDALARSTDAPAEVWIVVDNSGRPHAVYGTEAAANTYGDKTCSAVRWSLVTPPAATTSTETQVSTPGASGEGERIHTLVKSCHDCPSARYVTGGRCKCELAAHEFEGMGKPASFPAWCPLPLAASQAPAVPATKRLIGWRTSDYLMETNDQKQARGWQAHHDILPIFEGDEQTKMVDYRGLLRKYIDHIDDCEGTSFLGPPLSDAGQFTEQEKVELRRLGGAS